jgi:Helix-turn-helix domain
MDERLKFIARLLDGDKMAELCREFGVSRKTGYKILDRYNSCGLHAHRGSSETDLNSCHGSIGSNFACEKFRTIQVCAARLSPSGRRSLDVAIDGSKVKAVNNRDKNFTGAKVKRRMAQIEESVARYLQQLDTADGPEPICGAQNWDESSEKADRHCHVGEC